VIRHDWETLAQVAVIVLAAWAVARYSNRPARLLLSRWERAISSESADTSVLSGLKRRETILSLLQTTIRYAAFLIAAVAVFGRVSDSGALTAVAGASLLVLLVGFAAQRFLTDILTGSFMLFEGWFAVGDSVSIEPWKLEGIVEEVSLRATTLRAANGDTLRVHNSQILAVRVLPRGVRELDIELFCTDEDEGRRLVEEAARIAPLGPLHVLYPPRVLDVDRLDDGLHRIRAHTATAVGREWLVREFLVGVIKERASDGVLVHGPVVTETDATAARRYARSAGFRSQQPV
jgi:moderate conductance mechanosensitive channel